MMKNSSRCTTIDGTYSNKVNLCDYGDLKTSYLAVSVYEFKHFARCVTFFWSKNVSVQI